MGQWTVTLTAALPLQVGNTHKKKGIKGAYTAISNSVLSASLPPPTPNTNNSCLYPWSLAQYRAWHLLFKCQLEYLNIAPQSALSSFKAT